MIDDFDLRQRRRLGIFYTPRGVAEPICSWAIRRSTDVILDPSYGGCVFFAAAIDRLRALSSKDATRNLFGADVDPKARSFLSLLGNKRNALKHHFYEADFMTLRPSDFPSLFDSVIGNPPYVRHHKMSKKVMTCAKRATSWCELPETSSYWAYFVLHASTFLRAGGRLGMVLPGALLTADYAKPVWRHLLGKFETVRVMLVGSSVFSDAQERCVVLLAENYGGHCNAPTYFVVDTFEELARACSPTTRRRADKATVSEEPWPLPLLGASERRLIDRLRKRSGVCELGDLAKIRIGVVTGANDFFVLSPNRARHLALPSSALRSIFSSSRQLRALAVDERDLAALSDADVASLLLSASAKTTSRSIKRYLASHKAQRIRTRFKCSQRDPWFAVGDSSVPDAFLTYVNHFSPRLVLNLAGATATNAIHRLWWKRRVSNARQQLLSLASITSLFGVSAEICGRSIGGGALKVEISDAAKLLVVVAKKSPPGIGDVWLAASAALEASDWNRAREIADAYVLGKVLKLTAAEIKLLRSAHDKLKQVRIDTAGATPRRPMRRPPRRRTIGARR